MHDHPSVFRLAGMWPREMVEGLHKKREIGFLIDGEPTSDIPLPEPD